MCGCLLLAGIGLIFFIAAFMVLCFEFMNKTVLIKHQCLTCGWAGLTQHKASLLLTTAYQQKCWGAQEISQDC